MSALVNYQEKGLERITKKPIADIETVKIYSPESLCALGLIAEIFGLEISGLFLPNVVPDWVVSGYRDKVVSGGAQNSPHFFCQAFDVMIGNALKQIEFVKLATESNLFYRGGVYIGRNTCHIDRCDRDWQRKYGGAPFWVWHNGNYIGMSTIGEVASYVLSHGSPGD